MGLGNAIGIGIPMVSLGLGGGGAPVEERFVISVKTDNAGTSAGNEFTLPWIGTYDVDWGDGTLDSGVTNTQTHTYASAGTYDIAVTATTGKIYFNNGGDKAKLLDIKNWGTCQWTNLDRSFMGCNSLTDVTATDTPDFSNLIYLSLLFYNATSLTSVDVSSWDVSNVEQFDNMFVNCDITSLDVSNWNVSNAINLYDFVGVCSLLTTLDVSNWNVGNCSNFKLMFRNCPLLNPDVSNWDISSMTGVRNMFANVDSFDRSLANWGVIPFANNEWSSFMINSDGLSTINYDATLIAWAALTQTPNININFGGSQYSYEAASARQTLIDDYGWTITDGGQLEVNDETYFSINTTKGSYLSSDSDQFKLRLINEPVNLLVEWGDGTIDTITSYDQPEITHTYPSSGIYNVKITTSSPYTFLFNNGGDRNKMLDIKNWGNLRAVAGAFFSCFNLTVSATDAPVIPGPSLAQCFRACYNLSDIDVSAWDLSNVNRLNVMFNGSSNVDTSFANWDINQVIDFSNFLPQATLSTSNYNETLISWAAQSPQINKSISFGSSQYTLGGAAEAARDTLINTYGWTITDGGGVFVGVLDTYPNASAAYSLRDLASASVGSAVVRVRRSVDNTEQDFTSSEITDGTLTTFTGANDGFVTVWYDQSTNNNNATQSTAIQQPKLVSSGVVELENGKPCIIWDNTNDTMQINTSYSGSNLLSIFSVYNKTSPNPSDDSAYLVFADASLNVPDGVLAWRWEGKIGSYRSGAHAVNGSIPYDAQVNSNFIYTSTQVDFYNNSTLIGSKTTSNAIANFDYTFIQIGRGGGNTSFKNQELIIYPSDQSANRTGIETNINTEYTIY